MARFIAHDGNDYHYINYMVPTKCGILVESFCGVVFEVDSQDDIRKYDDEDLCLDCFKISYGHQ